jgi:hypothetical protein
MEADDVVCSILGLNKFMNLFLEKATLLQNTVQEEGSK